MSEGRRSAIDQFFSLSMPRKTVIHNRRLGIFFRGLQVVFSIVMVMYCVSNEPWQRSIEPVGTDLVVWCSGNSESHASAASNSDKPHCRDPASYSHAANSDFQFRPDSCRQMPQHEACLESGRSLFVPTFVQANNIWQGKGVSCGPQAEQWCKNRSATAEYAVDASVGTCSCTAGQEYFIANPEAQRLLILHGYEVDTAGGTNPRLVRGSSASGAHTEGTMPGNMEVTQGQMLTRIQSPNGEACSVGGRSDWSEADALAGIGGTLSEWLACAGVTLDTEPQSITPAASFPRHLRTMGLTLQLRLDYRNRHTDKFDEVDCYLTVVAMVTWTRRQRADLVTAPGPDHNDREVLRNTVYGVSIELSVQGKFWTYSVVDAVSFFVQSIVILQLPLFIVEFVALYCLGILSEIYRNAKRSQLNVYKHFHSAMARMMIAEMGFRGLMGGAWHGSVLNLHLTEQGVLEHLRDVFGEQISSGTLQMEELERMVAVTFSHIDADGTGSVTCGEFIHSFMSGELVTVPMMARYFDDDIKVGPLRVLLDSSFHERAHELKIWKANHQGRAEALTVQTVGSDEEAHSSQVSHESEGTLAKPEHNGEANGRSAQPEIGLEAIFRRLDALEAAGWEQRLSSLEALNLERRVAQLEADEILRREDSLRITRHEEDENAKKEALDSLIMRVDELDLTMVALRSEVWRGLDHEAMAMRDRLGRERSRESRDSGKGGLGQGIRRLPWSGAAPSSFALPPTDRRLHMMAEEAPPIWEISPAEKERAPGPLPMSRNWHGLPNVGQPSRENTGVSDSCLSKELRENSGSTLTTSYSNPWRSACRQMKIDV